jgi:hypothetical protein
MTMTLSTPGDRHFSIPDRFDAGHAPHDDEPGGPVAQAGLFTQEDRVDDRNGRDKSALVARTVAHPPGAAALSTHRGIWSCSGTLDTRTTIVTDHRLAACAHGFPHEHATGTQDAHDEHADDRASSRSTTERLQGCGALPYAERGSQLPSRVGMLDCGIDLQKT